MERVIRHIVYIYLLVVPCILSSQIDGGKAHSIVLCSDGSLRSTGANGVGQLGVGHANPVNSVQTISNISNVVQLSSGLNHNLALKEDGTVWSWGANNYGQLGLGNTNNGIVPQQVLGLNNIAHIETGEFTSYAIAYDGKLYAWGYNKYGQLGTGNVQNESLPVFIMDNVQYVSSAKLHTLVLKKDNSVYIFGTNAYGMMGTDSSFMTQIPIEIDLPVSPQKIVSGSYFNAVLSTEGKVYTWGFNRQGALGDGTFAGKISPVEVSLEGVKDIEAGDNHLVVSTIEGKVYTWGYNYNGELGDGSGSLQNSPVMIINDSNASIYSGTHHSFAVDINNKLQVWGLNSSNQITPGLGYALYAPKWANVGCEIKQKYICNANAVISFDTSSAVCSGSMIELSAEQSVNASTYSWYVNNMEQVDTSALINVSLESSGSQEIMLVVNEGGCRDSSIVFIEVTPRPNPQIDYLPDVCPNDAPLMLSGYPSSGNWSGPGVEDAIFNPLLAGPGIHQIMYEVTENGCMGTAIKDITVREFSPIVINANSEICMGDTLTVSAEGSEYFNWNTGQVGGETLVVLEESGYVEVIGTSSFLCPNSDSVFVQVVPVPQSGFSFAQDGTDVQFMNESEHSDDWLWSFGDGTFSNDEHPLHVYASGEDYVVELVASNMCGNDTLTDTVLFVLTGISKEMRGGIDIYPNPNSGVFSLNLLEENMGEKATLQVFNVMGEEVYRSTEFFNGQNQVMLPTLSNGTYTLNVSNDKNKYSTTFVIHK